MHGAEKSRFWEVETAFDSLTLILSIYFWPSSQFLSIMLCHVNHIPDLVEKETDTSASSEPDGCTW